MKKVPIFQPFKSLNEGFERLADIIEKTDDMELKYRLLIWHGCFAQTYNDEIKKEQTK